MPQSFSLASSQVELLRDLRQRNDFGRTSFKQDRDAWLRGLFGIRTHEKSPTKITPPARPELCHKRRFTRGLLVYQERANPSGKENARAPWIREIVRITEDLYGFRIDRDRIQ